ncbi:TPA: flippase [Candidatus Berkelbacteria bacterium]|uniref:Polysaccharide biosynthesis protein n=1 Tax=Berkelbacteria bacterium GW2011_GWE1_39_12 TaxID=1618337 RepID=A0A0G4B5G6_9BACT|nr:MAG: polysaccharide biosynthesis protein [Berkelbacteria bacterium GW2011_GWE1_39_12]HBO60785.1 flippase [Candidatus Berkelbacteria bacterium]
MLKHYLNILKQKSVKRLAVNSIWLTADNALRIFAGFFVGVWVARFLGPDNFGQWSYALSYVSIFAVLIGSSLNNVVVRELVKFPKKRNKILGSSFVLKFSGAIIAFLLSVFSIYLFSHQANSIKLMVLIVASGTIFQSFEVINYWFESRVESNYAVIARSIAFIVSNLLKIFFVLSHYSIVWFAVASAAEIFICAIAYLSVYKASKRKILGWRFDKKVTKKIFLAGLPLIIAGILATVYSTADKILVGSFINDAALGNYSVGTMLTNSWSFIATAITISVYPSIIYTKLNSVHLYERRMKKLYSLMVIMAIFMSLPISVFSHQIIYFLYGPKYDSAAIVLSIYVWTAVPAFLDIAGQKWLFAENLQKYLPIKTLIGSTVSIVLNLIFIPKYGVVGAAFVALLSISIATYFSNAFFKETRPLFRAQTLAIIKPRILG